MVGGISGLRIYSQTFGGRYAMDYLKIKTPFVGGIFQKIYMARFSRNLATLGRRRYSDRQSSGICS
jgi:type II secretory pathway component PulF